MSLQQTMRRTTAPTHVRVASAAETRPSILHYERVEAQSWAPWLRFSRSVLTHHVRAFPEDQFFAYDEDGLVGALSTNRISWDGDPASLSSWRAVAGARLDYQDTHVADGNTLVTLSMSVAERSRGSGVAGRLLDAVRTSARARGLEHVIGSYRPPAYGNFKLSDERDFRAYADMRRRDGLPLDPWLRSLTRLGMQRLGVDQQAMVVEMGLRDFETLGRGSSSPWIRVVEARDAHLHEAALPFPVTDCEFWEVGQTGTWYVNREAGQAVYIESGVWGAVPLDGPEV